MVFGKMIKEMDSELKYGRMVMFIKEIGLMIWNKAKVISNGLMVILMMVNGLIIKNMDLVLILQQLMISILENG